MIVLSKTLQPINRSKSACLKGLNNEASRTSCYDDRCTGSTKEIFAISSGTIGSQCRIFSNGDAGHFTLMVATVEAEIEEQAGAKETIERTGLKCKNDKMKI